MDRFALRRRAAVAVVLLAALPAARAQDAPPAPGRAAPPAPAPRARTVEGDLDAARALMKQEKWADASAAMRKVFEDYKGSTEVIRHGGDIEEDLKVCLFRSQLARPSSLDLFGPFAKSMDTFSRKVTFGFPYGPEDTSWEGSPATLAVLKMRFEGEVSVQFEGTVLSGAELVGIGVMFCYDPDRKSGYLLTPGFGFRDLKNIYTQDTAILIIDEKGGKKELAHLSTERPSFGAGRPATLKVKAKRTFSSLQISSEGGKSLNVSNADLKGGYLGIRAGSATNIVVSGAVEALTFRSLLGAWQEKHYREWLKDTWKREEVIPDWILHPAAGVVAAPDFRLPADQPIPAPAGVALALGLWWDGDRSGFVDAAGKAEDLSPGCRLYLEGLTSLATGRLAEAVKRFDRLIELDPLFAPGRLYRGMALLASRDLERARQDLEAAREGTRSYPELWVALARLSVLSGDLERAQAILQEGRAAGVGGAEFEETDAWILRSRRGPPWTKRFEAQGKTGTVASDHSIQLCNDVCRTLDIAIAACTALFPKTTRPSAPIRAYVFSSRGGFLNYAGDLGRNLDSAAGAYLPRVRELVLFVPDISREDLWATVRHEGFHAFLHDLVDEAPPWFDEGWAQCMEHGKVEFGTIRMTPLDPDERDAVAHAVKTEEFLLLDHEQFMKDPRVNYPLCRALVTFLFTSEKPRYRERLFAFFESLRAGLSAKEAYEKDFKPVIGELHAAFNVWLLAPPKEGGK